MDVFIQVKIFEDVYVWGQLEISMYWTNGRSRISSSGGTNLVGGAPPPDASTFHKMCLSKQKNQDP